MKIKFNKKDILSIINRKKVSFVVVCLICILGSLAVGKLNYTDRYTNYFTIQLGSDLVINEGEDEYNEVNNILFNIETLVKSEEMMENVVSRISVKSKIDNSYDLRETIKFVYDINNRNITLKIISENDEDSKIISKTLRSVLNEDLPTHIKDVSLEFGKINSEDSIKVGNSNKNYIIIGILLAIYINILLVFFLFKEGDIGWIVWKK